MVGDSCHGVAITKMFIFDRKLQTINARAMLCSVFKLMLGQFFIWYPTSDITRSVSLKTILSYHFCEENM